MGDRLCMGIPPRYVTKPTRSTQPSIPMWFLIRVPALTGQGKVGNATSVGWQITLHCVIPYGTRVAVAVRHVCELLYSVYFTFTMLTHRRWYATSGVITHWWPGYQLHIQQGSRGRHKTQGYIGSRKSKDAKYSAQQCINAHSDTMLNIGQLLAKLQANLWSNFLSCSDHYPVFEQPCTASTWTKRANRLKDAMFVLYTWWPSGAFYLSFTRLII